MADEKCHLSVYRHVFVTNREIFKGKFPAVICSHLHASDCLINNEID